MSSNGSQSDFGSVWMVSWGSESARLGLGAVQPEAALERCDQGGPLLVAGKRSVRNYELR
jgi:hypothetical protein